MMAITPSFKNARVGRLSRGFASTSNSRVTSQIEKQWQRTSTLPSPRPSERRSFAALLVRLPFRAHCASRTSSLHTYTRLGNPGASLSRAGGASGIVSPRSGPRVVRSNGARRPNPGCTGLASLAGEPPVSCATVDTSVAHHTPSPSGSVPRASAPVTAPRCIRRALAFRPRSSACQRPHPNPRRIQRRRRVPSEVLYGAQRRSNRPRSLRPGPSRPRPHGSDSITRPRSSLPFPGASHRPSRRRTVISPAQSPGFSQCPASQLIAFAAPLRRQRLLRMPPERPWQGYGLGHTPAPLHRLPAQLTPRAADSRRSAPLAADATVRSQP